MVPLQDIDLSTRNNRRMRIMLRSQNGGFFVSLQELIMDGSYEGLYSEFSSPMFKFRNVESAFEYAVKASRLFLSYANDDIVAINNSCNCELISEDHQKSILASLGLTITPTINQ